MIKGSLLLSAPIVKHFQTKKTKPSVFWAKIWRFLEISRGLILNLSFLTQKRHILVWFHV